MRRSALAVLIVAGVLTAATCSPQTPSPGPAPAGPGATVPGASTSGPAGPPSSAAGRETPTPSAPAPARPEKAGAALVPEKPYGPFDLYIFHNPDCHVCEMIVALQPDMEKLSPDLDVILENNTVVGASDLAKQLRKDAKVPAESWGPSIAVFVGDGWNSERGVALLQSIHSLLKDRVEVEPRVWTGDDLAPDSLKRDRMQILAEFRAVKPRDLLGGGLRYGLSFPLLAAWFCMVGLLILAGGGARRTTALAFGFWAGAVLLVIVHTLGGFTALRQTLSTTISFWGSMATYSLLAILGLALARSRWRVYRGSFPRAVVAPEEDAAPASGAPAPATDLGVTANRLRCLAVGGLVLGAILACVALVLRPPAQTIILAEVWRLGDVPSLVAAYLACFLLPATGLPLLIALMASLLTASPAVRRRLPGGSPELHFAGVVTTLVMALFLLAQVAIELLDRLPVG